MEEYIKLPEDSVKNELGVSFSKLDSLIPYTIGTSFRPNQESSLIVLFSENSSEESNLNLDKRAKIVAATVKNSNVINYLFYVPFFLLTLWLITIESQILIS